MRIAFVVNRVETEIDEYATTRLAKAAALMGHEVWYVGLGDLRIGEPDGEIGAHARPGIARDDDTLTAFVDRVKESSAERIRLDKLDAVFLRNDSIEDLQDRPWASSLGAVFGQLLEAHGVTVVNDPTVLMRAGTKVYLDEFPAEIRPRSLMTRNEEDVRDFISSVGRSIIKPLCGAKGRNVFMVDGEDEPNLNQMMEAVLEDGYIYAQGYVDGAEEGDMRIFLLDGELIEVDGHVSAFRRVPEGNDPRANICAGGRMQPGDITEKQRARGRGDARQARSGRDVLRRHRRDRRQSHRDQRREPGRSAGDRASVRGRYLPGCDRRAGAPDTQWRGHADSQRIGHFAWTPLLQYQHYGSPSSPTGRSPSVAVSTNSGS